MSKDYVLGYIDENDYDEYISLDGDTLQATVRNHIDFYIKVFLIM